MLQKLKIVLASFLLFCSLWPSLPAANAQSSNVVFSELQTGGLAPGTAAQEFIEIYNNSALEVNITGWKIVYSTSTDGSPKDVANFTGVIKPNSYILLVSPTYPVPNGVVPDFAFEYTSGLASTGGHLKLLDSSTTVIDKLGWGTASQPETTATSAPVGGSSLNRKNDQNALIDTDNNAQDFLVSTTVSPQGGGLGPVTLPIPPDECPNIDGSQSAIPEGLVKNEVGDCVSLPTPDPDPEPDPAPDPDPTPIPDPSPEPTITYANVYISELLPNPASPKTDSEDEFVELYNPNNDQVNLKNYVIQTGGDNQYHYTLPEITLGAHEYKSFYSGDTGLILGNTTSKARILAPNDEVVGESPAYEDVGEDEAWALIDSTWQVTNRPSPDAENLASVTTPNDSGGKGADDSTFTPCPPGKYRNPDTNRCRNIEVATSLTPCNAGQFRSAETNRCRKISTAGTSLAPCASGQYRNAQTNRCRKVSSAGAGVAACKVGQYRNLTTKRCRKIASANTVAPCKEGYERNKETNRCRKVLAALANNPLTDVASAASKPVSYPVIGVVGILALGYGIFEYRQELRKHLTKLKIKK